MIMGMNDYYLNKVEQLEREIDYFHYDQYFQFVT